MANFGWSHQDEASFIRRIGSFSPHGKELGSEKLLVRYRDSMQKRKRWGNVKPDEILKLINHYLKYAGSD